MADNIEHQDKGEQEWLERKQLGMSRFAQSCQIDIKQASGEY